MFWVIQKDIIEEARRSELLGVLERRGLSYSLHDLVPNVRRLEPPAAPPAGPVIVLGAATMNHVARASGWSPGTFLNENFDFRVQLALWGAHLLNAKAEVTIAAAVKPRARPFFIRPIFDSKVFTGSVMEWPAFLALRDAIGMEVEVLVSDVRALYREARLWVVDEAIVTSSLYRLGNQVVYAPLLPGDPLLDFGAARAREWSPARAYVLDVCETAEGPRIVEVNNLNAAGFYSADLGRLVDAIEGMTGYEA